MFGSSISDNAMFGCPSRELAMERRWNSNNSNNIESAPNCPRCASSNTKFCYYNNYSLSQPRYFCKGCRRYWTKGGSLRNVPVGGGCRKSRKSRSASRQLVDHHRSSGGLSYQMPSPGGTSDNQESTGCGSSATGVNIDLAAVFARFLNQDSSNNNEAADEDQSSSSGGSYNSLEYLPPGSSEAENHDHHELEDIIFESQKPYDFIDGADQMHEGLPPLGIMDHNIGDTSVEELLVQDNCDSLNLQAILGDEIAEGPHHLLSDGTSLPNFDWQSIMQFQDFGSSFSNDIDDMKIPSNVAAAENWSSFDLSGYEIFPRHWNCN